MGFLVFLNPFWPLIWRILAIAAVVGAALWGWNHFVANPYIQRGVEQQMVVTQEWKDKAQVAIAANEALSTDLEALRTKVATANKAIDDMKKASDATMKLKATLMAALVRRTESLKAEVDRLTAIANGPPAASMEEACAEADRILDALAVRRHSAQP